MASARTIHTPDVTADIIGSAPRSAKYRFIGAGQFEVQARGWNRRQLSAVGSRNKGSSRTRQVTSLHLNDVHGRHQQEEESLAARPQANAKSWGHQRSSAMWHQPASSPTKSAYFPASLAWGLVSRNHLKSSISLDL